MRGNRPRSMHKKRMILGLKKDMESPTVSCQMPGWEGHSVFLNNVAKYTISRWGCDPWAQTTATSDVIFFGSVLAVLLYTYTLITIFTTRTLDVPFKICASCLAVADFTVLLTSSREACLHTCVLYLHEDLHMARLTFVVFTFDLRACVVMLMAVVRLNEMVHRQKTVKITIIGAVLCFLVAGGNTLLEITGNLDRICYIGIEYREVGNNFAQDIRSAMHFTIIGVTITIYLACFIKLMQIRVGANKPHTLANDQRFLFGNFFIFIGQLLFAYATCWVGLKWGITNPESTHAIYCLLRPLCAASTPIIYLLFIPDLRLIFKRKTWTKNSIDDNSSAMYSTKS